MEIRYARRFVIHEGKGCFGCPEDIAQAIAAAIADGAYPDRSKAIIGILRHGLDPKRRFSPDLEAKIAALASSLHWPPETVVEQCVEGILEMIEAAERRIPLFIEEVRLRGKNGRGSGNRNGTFADSPHSPLFVVADENATSDRIGAE